MTMDQVTSIIIKFMARRSGGLSAVGIAGALGLWWALSVGLNTARFWSRSLPAPATVEVDRGDVVEVVVEYGSLESSDDDVVRCQVESFLGLPVGAPVASAQFRPSPPTRSGLVSKGVSSTNGTTGRATIAAVVK